MEVEDSFRHSNGVLRKSFTGPIFRRGAGFVRVGGNVNRDMRERGNLMDLTCSSKLWREGFQAQQLFGLARSRAIERAKPVGMAWGIVNAEGWNVSLEFHSSADAAWEEFDARYGPCEHPKKTKLFEWVLRTSD